MERDAVEADRLGGGGAVGEGGDDIGDLAFGHRPGGLAHGGEVRRVGRRAPSGGSPYPRWAHRRRVGIATAALAAHHALVPQLREDQPAGSVDLVNHLPPSGERRLPEHFGHGKFGQARIADRGRVSHGNALGDDQRDVILGAPAVVGGHIGSRHAVGRPVARHRRHDDAVLEGHAVVQPQRREQRIGGDGHRHHLGSCALLLACATWDPERDRLPIARSTCPIRAP